MKVFYNPLYSGFVYFDFSQNKVLYDTVVCNTKSLVDLLELHAGIHISVAADIDRVLDYYNAMKTFLKQNPDNCFAKSFERDGINTAKECLLWRDEMILAGWKPGSNDASERMKTLSAIEKNFDSPSYNEKLLQIIGAVDDGCILPENLEIIIPFEYDCFLPAEKRLLDSLAKRIGSENIHCNQEIPQNKNYLRTVTDILVNNKPDELNLAKSDKSFEVLEFNEKSDALKYLSQLSSDEYSVWINRDNRGFDSWLSYLNKPTCGSTDKGVSQISELPLIGLGIFSRPLNLSSLISWLSVPVSPLSFPLRKKLISAIVDDGGYFNKKCREVLSFADEKDKARIPYFLPDIDKPEEAVSLSGKIKKSLIEDYVNELSNWISKKLLLQDMNETQENQLMGAYAICKAMSRILTIFETDEISFEDLILVFDSLSTEIESEISESKKGCQNLIGSSVNFASPADSTIWCDFYDPEETTLKYDFLLPSEKAVLPDVWTQESERKFNRMIKLIPFIYTKNKLALVTVLKDGTGDVVKDPLIIRLRENMGKDKNGNYLLDSYLTRVNVTELPGVKTKKVNTFNNRYQNEDGTVNFSRTDLVNFREVESFSAISTLIDYPFDYVFDKIIRLRKTGVAALSEVYTTKGTVAHEIIEELFSPEHGGTSKDIENQIKTNFEKVFDMKVLQSGGILLQKENLSATAIFKEDMKSCVSALLNFIKVNGLKVVACEQEHDNAELPEFSKHKIFFDGSIDMVLSDKEGETVILDFKFSPKEDKYEDWIRSNRSMQLSLYKGLVYKATKNHAKAAAYVLLPGVKVITPDNLKGPVFKVNVDPDREGNLLAEMSNSYDFRKKQILSGIVEDGEGIEFPIVVDGSGPTIEYIAETENQDLVPMDIETYPRKKIWKKHENQYSSFSTFKAGE